jgi:beta-lactamase class A
MAVDSDNIAKDILLDHISQQYLNDVFQEMDVGYLQSTTGTISARSYIRFLSRLYNATFLDRSYSNYALKLLSEATFKDGLVAGVPSDVPIAHKYGERGIYEDNALTGVELHDCGIVYAKETPYYLCVMTSGKDEATLAGIIKEISAKVYADRISFAPPPTAASTQ